jgi:hypothetical protein
MVLVIQNGLLTGITIPSGYEERIREAVKSRRSITIKGKTYPPSHIKGIFTEQEFENLQLLIADPPKGSGYKDFLEFGQALRKKQSLSKWKKKYGDSTS